MNKIIFDRSTDVKVPVHNNDQTVESVTIAGILKQCVEENGMEFHEIAGRIKNIRTEMSKNLSDDCIMWIEKKGTEKLALNLRAKSLVMEIELPTMVKGRNEDAVGWTREDINDIVDIIRRLLDL